VTLDRDSARRTIGILVYDEVEVLDVAGPFEVLSVATRVAGRRSPGGPPFRVVLVSRDGRPVRARAGFVMSPDHALGDAPNLDVLLVPGGVQDAVERDERVIRWVRERSETVEAVASVCTGAFVLAAAGLLDGRVATTHWEDAADLAERYPSVRVEPDRRWVDLGDVATSAGISAGIDLALHLVDRFEGRDLARATARQMDYPWPDAAGPAGRPTE
jgi:transcriptional regulator GlxA family with amidase domain